MLRILKCCKFQKAQQTTQRPCSRLTLAKMLQLAWQLVLVLVPLYSSAAAGR